MTTDEPVDQPNAEMNDDAVAVCRASELLINNLYPKQRRLVLQYLCEAYHYSPLEPK